MRYRILGAILFAYTLWVGIQFLLLSNIRAGQLFLLVLAVLIILLTLYRRSMLFRCGQVLTIYCGDGHAELDWFRIKRHGWTWVLPYTMPDGVSVTRLRNHTEPIEQALHCSFAVDYYSRRFWCRVGTRRLPQLLHWKEMPQKRPMAGLTVWLGRSQWGELWVDITELPHWVIGGTTRSGKSVQMRSVLTQLFQHYDSRYVKVALVDLKGRLEFNLFEGLPHLMGEIRHDIAGYAELVDELEVEIQRRFEILRRGGHDDIHAYNASLASGIESPDWMPYLCLFIDEFGRLQPGIGIDQAARQQRQNLLARTAEFAALGAALGIHLVVGTQRPDAQVFPGDLKANFPAAVALRVKNTANSMILLDNPLAATLPVAIRGRGIFQWDEDTFFQGPWIPKQLARTLLDPLRNQSAKQPIQEEDEELIPPGETIPDWAHAEGASSEDDAA